MFLTEQNGSQMWQKMLKENFNVNDTDKLNWVSDYAANHEIFESNLGVNAAGPVAATPGMVPGDNGVGPVYSTPLNTTGMGNPMAPGYVNGQVPTGFQNDFGQQRVGSGEVPLSTLPMALNIALMTIGLELVPVIPTKGPWQLLSYMDTPYAGGKLGVARNLTKMDGFGKGNENKPLYVKFLANTSRDFLVFKGEGEKGYTVKENDTVIVKSTNGEDEVTFTGRFKSFGRMDGGLILETVSCQDKTSKDVAIMDLFTKGATVTAEVGEESAEIVKVDFAQTMVDFIDGFANFYDGKKKSMTRAENETGTGNTIGLRIFSRWIQVGSYEVTGTVTRQQLQDLPLYGVDAVGKVMESMQNEITQHINARILEELFALGVTNWANQKVFQGVDLNLWMASTEEDATLEQFAGIKDLKDVNGYDHLTDPDFKVKNVEVLTSAENLHTRQRRISSRVLAAANLIQVTGRRGRPNWIVTNAQVATALQDCSNYVVAPMVNTMAQDGSQNLYMAGTLAGLKVYVDPYMTWEDTRICVGRKGDGNSPGLVFMPYILADQVSITAEGTMAPKMLVNSRFALTPIGFYPEAQYYTFVVGSEFGII